MSREKLKLIEMLPKQLLLLVVTGMFLAANGQDAELRRLSQKVANLQGEIENMGNRIESLSTDFRKDMNSTFEVLAETVRQALETGISEALNEVESVCNSSSQAVEQNACWYTGSSQKDAVLSCQSLRVCHPHASSGYYWVTNSTGSAVSVYCDMGRHCCGSTGGWMRVAYLNVADISQQCPEGFRLRTSPKRVCERTVTPGCTSITFPVHSVPYSRVCGRVKGYQDLTTDGFQPYYATSAGLDELYVDGISITHGAVPRKHIWTFAATISEAPDSDIYACPCTRPDTPYTRIIPPFVGTDYFCDTGNRVGWRSFVKEDPLWDGHGCGSTSSCCQFNSPPWFCKNIPQPTTDDIEVRVCSDWPRSNEDIPFELIELYIQ